MTTTTPTPSAATYARSKPTPMLARGFLTLAATSISVAGTTAACNSKPTQTPGVHAPAGTLAAAEAPSPGVRTEAAEAQRHAAGEPLAFKALGRDRAAVSVESGLTSEDRAAYVDGNLNSTECADALVRAQWQHDIAKVLAPEAHFDNCRVAESLAYLRAEYVAANGEAQAGHVFPAIEHLGRVLHSVEDFYAHTDFVELASVSTSKIEEAPRLELWDGARDGGLAPFRDRLVSGRVAWESGSCRPDVATHHDMNKDGPDTTRGSAWIASWSMTHYRAAAELTRAACGKLLKDTLNRPQWTPVVNQCGTTYGFALHSDGRRD